MINNKALVYSYVAKMFADGTKYHESIKESDNVGYIDDAVEDIKKVAPYAIEATKAQSLRDVGVELLPFEEHEGYLTEE